MIHVIRSEERYFTEIDWLKSYWHFSFDRYYNPDNMSFGALRVFNEDWISPLGGFPMHPHRDMEIITYVIRGTLEHRDNTDSHGKISAGEVQRMTAGTGIYHSEFNASGETECHLLQIWIIPETKGLKPGWDQKKLDKSGQKDRLLQVVSGRNSPDGVMKINQDASIYLSNLGSGKTVTHYTNSNRKIYLFVIRGKLDVNDIEATTGDQVRAEGEKTYRITTGEQSEFILIDLPE